MIKETSAGVVIFRRERKQTLFLLLHYPSGHWDFVKGKNEEGESMQHTATREAEEETGISDITFVSGFEEWIRYSFQHDNKTINKKVVFFLGETNTKDVAISHEHLDYEWADYQTAKKRVTFDNAKRVLDKSRALLNKTL